MTRRPPQDVIILGAGVIGCAIADHLLRLEPRLGVTLVDAHHVGAGSTSRSTAAFRHQWSVPAHVAFSDYGSRELDRLSALGYGVDFRRNGYLFLYTDPAALAHAADRVARQRALGIDVLVLGPDDVKRLPCGDRIRIDELAGATWGPRDGFLDPLAVAQAYLDEARRAGAAYLPDRPVTGFDLSDAGGTSVRLADGSTIPATRIIVAAGVWSDQVVRLAGLDLPLRPAKRYLYHTHPIRDFDVSRWPLLIGDRGAHCRPSGGNTLMMAWERLPEPLEVCPDGRVLWEEQDTTPAGFSMHSWGLTVLEELARQVPSFAEAVGLAQVTSGWYPETLDNKAILGPDPRLPGLYLATGHGGHGIMHAPATGLTLAEVILDRETTLLSRKDLDAQFGLEPLLTGRVREPREEMGL